MNHAIKALLLGLCCALPVLVSAADEDPDQAAAHTRHALMELMGWNMKTVVAMSTGKQEFSVEAAVIQGERLAQLGAMIGDAFARDTSAADVKTAALPAVWQDSEDFAAKAQALIDNATAYSEAAAGGAGPARKAFIQLGGSCKGCHENYKAE